MSASIWPATSLTRSDPLGQFGEVITTGIALARQASATSSASVATTTGSIRPLALAARHTHSIIGRPAIGRSTLRAKRFDPSRAGITAAMRSELMQTSVNAGNKGPREQGTEKTWNRQWRAAIDLPFSSPVSSTLALLRVVLQPTHPPGGVAQMVRAWDS